MQRKDGFYWVNIVENGLFVVTINMIGLFQEMNVTSLIQILKK